VLRITIMNAKGGCGKTTVATNLASYCSVQGYGTVLFDYDRQASSIRWLKARPAGNAAIHGIAAFAPPPKGMTRTWQMQIPQGTQYIIADTPAGYAGIDLKDRIAESDIILIPMLPSSIDIHATADFIHELQTACRTSPGKKIRIGIIANRARIHSRNVESLERFIHDQDVPVVSYIRDTSYYVRSTEQGLGVHELPQRGALQDRAPWEEIFSWLHQSPDQVFSVPPPSISFAMPAGK
jgi:chromosome partitioning protein